MPGGDRSGPAGQGPRTGRAAGYCSGSGMPGYTNAQPGRGAGRGFWWAGFGRGGRRGGGRWAGFCRGGGWGYGWAPGAPDLNTVQAGADDELYASSPGRGPRPEGRVPDDQARTLVNDLAGIRARLEALEHRQVDENREA